MILSTGGGVHGQGMFQGVGDCGWGTCMALGMHGQGRGVCVAGEACVASRCAWPGACALWGGMRGLGGSGVCGWGSMCGREGGVHHRGHTWQGGGIHGRGGGWVAYLA